MLEFTVEGMSCGHCEKAIKNAIREMDGEATVTVELNAKRVLVQSLAPKKQIEEAIKAAGFEVM